MMKSMKAIQFLVFTAMLGLLSACSSSSSGGSGGGTVTIPANLQGQYTLNYFDATPASSPDDGLVGGQDYNVIIASDNSLTIGSTVMNDPKEEDLFGTGITEITWRNGDYAYVLSTKIDGSLNEINVFDTRLTQPAAFVGQLK